MKSKSRQEGVRGRHRRLKKPDKLWMSCLMVSPPQPGGSELFTTGSSQGAHTAGWSELMSELELL